MRVFIRLLVRPSARVAWKSRKTSILENFRVCVSRVWGVDGGWPPPPTRSQRYCDPAFFVSLHRVKDLVALEEMSETISVKNRKQMNGNELVLQEQQ